MGCRKGEMRPTWSIDCFSAEDDRDRSDDVAELVRVFNVGEEDLVVSVPRLASAVRVLWTVEPAHDDDPPTRSPDVLP